MRVVVNGSAVTLNQKDFVASGGEGSVYSRGSTAFKIYHDPAKMIPLGKIQELGAVKDPHVVRPIDVLYDERGSTPVGYTMPYVTDTVALCQLFPRAFRDRSGLDPQRILSLVRKLQSLVAAVHTAGILIVDLNEMNFLVDATFEDVYALDADSWQTPHFRATALMESVRDRHMLSVNGPFSPETDWFSFAVVSFQLFIGIHPYKGKHPSVKDMDGRMKQNLSVLNSVVTRPQVCYPLAVIPPVYLDWYTAVLERGARGLPPVDLVARIIPAAPIAAAKSTQRLEITSVLTVSFPIATVGYRGARFVPGDRVGAVGFAPSGRPVTASILQGGLSLRDVDGRAAVPYTGAASAVAATRGTLHALSGDKVVEVVLSDVWQGVVASPLIRAEVLPKATRLFEGVAMSDLLGSAWAYLLPMSGYCAPTHLRELDGRRVIDAKFEPLLQRSLDPSGVLVVVSEKSGHYDRFVFRFASAFQSYDVEVVPDIPISSPNFAVLDTGVCVLMDEDERLVVFSALPNSSGRKIVEDDSLSGDMRLFAIGGVLHFHRGNTVYSMRLR